MGTDCNTDLYSHDIGIILTITINHTEFVTIQKMRKLFK